MQNDVIEGVAARYWHRLEDGRIQCDVCPRYCRLHEGQRGLCFVRARQGDEVLLTTWGRSSGFCVDPIEKKPLNHFLPGTPVLSFGTAGCNLTCKFCQNWDISKARQLDRLQDQATPEAIAIAAERSGCRSVAYTYNDPVIFLEYAIDVAQACRERGIRNVAVSAGYDCAAPRRAPSSTATWTPPTSTSRRSPRASTGSSARARSSRCSRRWSTSGARPGSGSR
jgi:pyruvate formate lyase activating enzyme